MALPTTPHADALRDIDWLSQSPLLRGGESARLFGHRSKPMDYLRFHLPWGETRSFPVPARDPRNPRFDFGARCAPTVVGADHGSGDWEIEVEGYRRADGALHVTTIRRWRNDIDAEV